MSLIAINVAPAAAAPINDSDKPLKKCLIEAYPDHLCSYLDNTINWCDGSSMPFATNQPRLDAEALRTWSYEAYQARLKSADLRDQMSQRYPGPGFDPGRLRHEPLFKKMYGATSQSSSANTIRMDWPAKGMGTIRVTTINGIAKKLQAIGANLMALVPSVASYLTPVGGSFMWRTIAGSDQLSVHSFGIAIDLALRHADYWRWQEHLVANPGLIPALAPNQYPAAIIATFEREGFIWGGHWHYYDTMHFEYRPELFCLQAAQSSSAK